VVVHHAVVHHAVVHHAVVHHAVVHHVVVHHAVACRCRPVGTSKSGPLSCQGPFPAASPVVALPVESAVVPEVAPPVASPVVALPTCLSHLPRLHEKIMLSIVGRRAMSAASALTPTNTNFIITDRLGSVSSSAATPHSSTEKALMGDQFSWVPYLLISVAQFAADYAQLNWLPQDS